MKICLKTSAKNTQTQKVAITINERLPQQMQNACRLDCSFNVYKNTDHYLLNLIVNGSIDLVCQRCLGYFKHTYESASELAVCFNETVAETLMLRHECIVATHAEIDLLEVLTDDLHLSLPERHAHVDECDEAVGCWIRNCAVSDL